MVILQSKNKSQATNIVFLRIAEMPPEKRGGFGRKSANAKFMENHRKNLAPEAQSDLRKATKESVQKYRANLTEEKKLEIKQQDREYKRHKR